jgi:hypothetical protein
MYSDYCLLQVTAFQEVTGSAVISQNMVCVVSALHGFVYQFSYREQM